MTNNNKLNVHRSADTERHPPPKLIQFTKYEVNKPTSQVFSHHTHGGQLQAASQQYNIPLADWLDLSTGISPFAYPLPLVPTECWQRLPETNDGLEAAATNYYGSSFLLSVSGSQEAIQRLPTLFPKGQRVGIIRPAYLSHQQAWRNAGHQVNAFTSSEIDQQLPNLDVLILVNPTNPSAESFSPEIIMRWYEQLVRRNAYLIIDEAFMDATPEQSTINKSPKPGLIVLRSIGKFFGLAGVRLGFVWAETKILEQLASKQDDWSVSHPARWAGAIALQDTPWQQQQKKKLLNSSERLKNLLEKTFKAPVYHTALFSYFRHKQAQFYHQELARNGVLTRLLEHPLALRFGIPGTDAQWCCLKKILELKKIKYSNDEGS